MSHFPVAHLSSVVIKIEGIRVLVTARKLNHLDKTTETKVLLDNDIWDTLETHLLSWMQVDLPLTAAMTKRI